MKSLLPVGAIVGVHGVHGVVKVRSHFGGDTIYGAGSRLFVKNKAGREAAYRIDWSKPHKGQLLVRFEGVEQKEQAEELIGATIRADRDALPALEEGEFYGSDLIGLSVCATDGTHLGHLEDIIETGSNDVYVVRNGSREILVPALASVVKQVDLARRRMVVDLPEGL